MGGLIISLKAFFDAMAHAQWRFQNDHGQTHASFSATNQRGPSRDRTRLCRPTQYVAAIVCVVLPHSSDLSKGR